MCTWFVLVCQLFAPNTAHATLKPRHYNFICLSIIFPRNKEKKTSTNLIIYSISFGALNAPNIFRSLNMPFDVLCSLLIFCITFKTSVSVCVVPPINDNWNKFIRWNLCNYVTHTKIAPIKGLISTIYYNLGDLLCVCVVNMFAQLLPYYTFILCDISGNFLTVLLSSPENRGTFFHCFSLL